MATTKLTPLLRRVLYMRISGMTHPEIAEVLGVKPRTVHTYMKRIHRVTLSGITDWGDGSRKWVRMAYVVGLIDGGATLEEIPALLERFEQRIHCPPNDAEDDPEPVMKPHHNWQRVSR